MKYLGLIIISFAVVLCAACSQGEKSKIKGKNEATLQDARPNILFVLVDDLGFADISTYNADTFYETPNIDRLAREGVLFTNGYAANPVCSPSRAAIMTGKHPTRLKATEWFHINDYPHREERFRHGVSRDYLAAEEQSIAETFKDNGYQTAFLGKWHLGDNETLWPTNQGFDVNIGGAGFGFPRGGYFSPYNNPNLDDGPEGEYLTDRLTDDAVSLMMEYGENKAPFFVFLSYYTVHVPLEAPSDIVEKYTIKGGGDVILDENEHRTDDQYFISEPGPRKVRTVQNNPVYAAMMEKLDDNIGKLVSALKASGQYENTIIVFTSDNGGVSTSETYPTSNLPLRGAKGWLYEGGIRVPLIVRAPTQAVAGASVDVPFVGIDFLPTLASLSNVGLQNQHVLDGVDLSATIVEEGPIENNDRAIFWHYPHYSNQGGFPGAAVRRGDYKLLQNFEDGSLQLYNLSTDIGEQTNLNMSEPAVTQELEALLYKWYEETDAEFLRPRLDRPDIKPWRPTKQAVHSPR